MTDQELAIYLFSFKVEDITMLSSLQSPVITGHSPVRIDRTDLSQLIGKSWGSWSVKGVETFAHGRPYIEKGEGVGFLLQKTTKRE